MYHFRWNNEKDCVKHGDQWYEFYDYKNILSQIIDLDKTVTICLAKLFLNKFINNN